MYILGISAYYHDSAAAIIEDGVVRAAAQEERFSRKKGDNSFPHQAISYCLDACGIREDTLDYVIFYEDPMKKFDRLMTSYHLTAPFGWRSFLQAIPSWLNFKLWMERGISLELGIKNNIILCDHHLSHAASAFYPSPYENAAIMTLDGVGEWSTATFGTGYGNKMNLLKQTRFPNSVGLLYSAFTYYTGFKVNSGEYKLMGLAPYGKPRYTDIIKEKIVLIKADGSIILNQKYFNYVRGLTMTNRKFHNLFGKPPRKPETQITQFEMDLAASIQDVLNEIILKMANHIYEETKLDNLVLGGGVALNCVSNGFLAHHGPFTHYWIQPAAGDAGGALGAALWLWYDFLKNERIPSEMDSMQGSFLGPEISPSSEKDDEILRQLGAIWESFDEEPLIEKIVESLVEGKVIAIARGRMEWGPRSLGSRSILGDARLETMQSHMNHKIKFRESFRPFAPMVLLEDAKDYFDMSQESPYMLFVHPVLESRRKNIARNDLSGTDLIKIPRSDIPAVTHIDYSARIQTIDKKRNHFMWSILNAFKKRTGYSVLINTSFNVRGEPIVNTVKDAYRCFMITEIDGVVIGNRFLERAQQNNRLLTEAERKKWLRKFDLD